MAEQHVIVGSGLPPTSKSYAGPVPVPMSGHCSVCKDHTGLAYTVRDRDTPEREAWVYVCSRIRCVQAAKAQIERLMRPSLAGGPGSTTH